MTTNDLKNLILDAQEHLNEAINLLDAYVRHTNDIHADAYILDHLKILAGRDHGFLASDPNLDDLLDALAETEAPDEPEQAPDDQAPDATIYIAGQPHYWCQSAGRYVTIPADEA